MFNLGKGLFDYCYFFNDPSQSAKKTLILTKEVYKKLFFLVLLKNFFLV